MALVLTEEQTMLRESAREFLRQRAPVSHLRNLRETGTDSGFSRELWAEMTDMGWPAIAVDEADGGLGFGYAGLGIVLQEAGRTLTPSPLLSSAMIAVAAIRHGAMSNQKSAWLPAIARGESIVVVATDEGPRHRPDAIDSTVQTDGSQLVLNGAKRFIADGMMADHFLVSARNPAGAPCLLWVPADAKGLTRERVQLLDTHVGTHVRFDTLRLDPDALLGGDGDRAATLSHALNAAAIGQSAELLGVGLEAFDRTLAYLRERKQFGVPIGNFQALQHRAAMLCNDLELCTSLVLNALTELDSGSDNLAEIASMTKAKVADTVLRVTAEAIQMHGGIGMTDEFDIGFFYKRARILETLLGDRHYHLDRYACQRGY